MSAGPTASPRWGWIVAVAALALLIAALACSAWRGPTWIAEAGAACAECVAERTQTPRGPGGCEERSAFALGVLPWLADARQVAFERCSELVRRRAIHHAARVFPDAERRDAWVAREPRPATTSARLWEYYEAGAFETLVQHVDEIDDDELHRAALFAAMHLRSLDAVRAVVAHELPSSSVAGAGWRGPWLCLLGEEEEGRRLLTSCVGQAERSPPDYYPLAYLAPIGPYACGGPEPHDLFREQEAYGFFLRLSRSDLAPEELFDDFDLPTEVRRAALAHWLNDADEAELELEAVLAAVAGTSSVLPRRCGPYGSPIDPGAPPIVVEVAERASDRLLSWLDDHDEELEALERTLPPLWLRTSCYDPSPVDGARGEVGLTALRRARRPRPSSAARRAVVARLRLARWRGARSVVARRRPPARVGHGAARATRLDARGARGGRSIPHLPHGADGGRDHCGLQVGPGHLRSGRRHPLRARAIELLRRAATRGSVRGGRAGGGGRLRRRGRRLLARAPDDQAPHDVLRPHRGARRDCARRPSPSGSTLPLHLAGPRRGRARDALRSGHEPRDHDAGRLRVRDVRLDPRAGPLVECEVVATRILGLERVIAESAPSTPAH